MNNNEDEDEDDDDDDGDGVDCCWVGGDDDDDGWEGRHRGVVPRGKTIACSTLIHRRSTKKREREREKDCVCMCVCVRTMSQDANAEDRTASHFGPELGADPSWLTRRQKDVRCPLVSSAIHLLPRVKCKSHQMEAGKKDEVGGLANFLSVRRRKGRKREPI